jgi:beta-lactamase class A
MTLRTDLERIAGEFTGTVGLWARSISTGEVVAFGAAVESFPSASVIKLPVLYELFRQAGEGRFQLEDKRVLTDEDKVPGAGVLQTLQNGLPLQILDLATLMMTISDNTASNMCIDLVGIDSVRQTMAGLGLPGLQLHNKFYKAVPGRPGNQVVPDHLGQLMDRIVRHEVLTPEACEQILGIMKRVQNPMSPRFFPEQLRLEPAPEGELSVVLASKTGAIQGVRNEVGAVWKGDGGFVFAILSRGCRDLRYHVDNEGELVVGRLAAALHGYFVGS